MTTFAITVFGVIGAWLIPDKAPSINTNIGALTFIGSILLIVILFFIFLFNHILRHVLRIYSTYLRVNDASNWEKDWKLYRHKWKWYFAYTKSQTIIFLLLGSFAYIFPFAIAYVYKLLLNPSQFLIYNSIFFVIYFLLVVYLGFFYDPEDKIEQRWKSLKNSNQGGNQ